MRKIFYLIYLSSLCGLSQTSYLIEDEIYKKANSYLRALKDNNRYELPSAEERKSMKNIHSITEYAREKAYENFEILTLNFPSSKSISYYYYQLGNLDYQKKMFEKSKINLYKSLDKNDLQSYYVFRQSKILLAKISINENKFDEARLHLKEIEKKQSYRARCGNEFFEQWNELKPLYEAIGLKLE